MVSSSRRRAAVGRFAVSARSWAHRIQDGAGRIACTATSVSLYQTEQFHDRRQSHNPNSSDGPQEFSTAGVSKLSNDPYRATIVISAQDRMCQ